MQIPIEDARKPLHLRIPFLPETVGLGSAIEKATGIIGVKPCTPCNQRKESLDRRIVFDPWRT